MSSEPVNERGLAAAVEALADEWECEPNPTEYHERMCPGCHRAARLRALLFERTATTGGDAS